MNLSHDIEQDIQTLETSFEVLSRVAARPNAQPTHVNLRNDLCAIASSLERSGKFVSVAMHSLQTQNLGLDASVAAVLDAVLMAIDDAEEHAENALNFSTRSHWKSWLV